MTTGRDLTRKIEIAFLELDLGISESSKKRARLEADLRRQDNKQARALRSLASAAASDRSRAGGLARIAEIDAETRKNRAREVEEATASIDRLTTRERALFGEKLALETRYQSARATALRTRADIEAEIGLDAAMIELKRHVAQAGQAFEAARAERQWHEDRRESLLGPFHRDERLFSYLKRRGYDTPAAKGWWLTRRFDAWVARRIGYRAMKAQYDRITASGDDLAGREVAAKRLLEAAVAAENGRWHAFMPPVKMADRDAAECKAKLTAKVCELNLVRSDFAAERRQLAAAQARLGKVASEIGSLIAAQMALYPRATLDAFGAEASDPGRAQAARDVAEARTAAKTLAQDIAAARAEMAKVEQQTDRLRAGRAKIIERGLHTSSSIYDPFAADKVDEFIAGDIDDTTLVVAIESLRLDRPADQTRDRRTGPDWSDYWWTWHPCEGPPSTRRGSEATGAPGNADVSTSGSFGSGSLDGFQTSGGFGSGSADGFQTSGGFGSGSSGGFWTSGWFGGDSSGSSSSGGGGDGGGDGGGGGD
ncbi:hypothetical protein [Phreatobacter stygius]|uniref:Uncharacterized protein n=1 Tax=Phreatobacter stygius TaxID=1940610 RepID=A0A4D7AQ46_9HYPH|nr:hypothetical protein [Phreatobacter stygius]QCI63354.1 hypothetical protein E8M01_03340 [Phreatobacter stygius]